MFIECYSEDDRDKLLSAGFVELYSKSIGNTKVWIFKNDPLISHSQYNLNNTRTTDVMTF